MSPRCTRRALLGAAAVVGTTAAMPAHTADPPSKPFLYALNTSTIRGQNLPLVEEIELAARAGYDGIEPWIRELDSHRSGGGSLAEIRRLAEDRGLKFVSAIGFFDWIVDDDVRRAKGLDEARRNMAMVAEIGGTTLAAPPAGATDTVIDLDRAAERYRVLCELGGQFGVAPQLEVWGFSRTLHTLAQTSYVATAASHPRACILADVYHLHRGGSGFEGLRLLNGAAMHAFHVNDYPPAPAAPELDDSHRVYPGDGSAPLDQILATLHQTGFRGALSVELFNRDYWKQDPLVVARTALEKLRGSVARALLAS